MTKAALQEELVGKLDMLRKELNIGEAKRESLEWYLLNNIDKYLSSLKEAKSSREVDNAASIFSRFCTESMDWDMPLYKQCIDITACGFRLAKVF